ncbi:glycosyl transferase [Palleronia abyssalis]|uniref:Glycosyltransferase subfamily 4-like N-terminal domain-containing protein n=1 Tax=Palleronia abyssalis TaxID=1501240 RepID=A0A2R8BZG3_9RHOB|nr:glycosyl transferase [Palleronia abyssalis]SPJ25530.1 hypothetical protein PAA8504_03381 [Palleronia abyssalis]
MKILYLAHDLDDAAIWRRVTMLEAGGADVAVAGFRRATGALPRDALVLGRTRNGQMVARALSVARLLPLIRGKLRAQELDCVDLVVARNLEMLLVGRAAVRGPSPRPALAYELLDIHRMMLGPGRVARSLRALEARLLGSCAALLISSPGFLKNYLAPYGQPSPQLMILENKVVTLTGVPSRPARLLPKEPGRITIGWFGILRCRWSLETLDAMTRATPGRYRIVLRGKPALDVLPDFHDRVSQNPDLEFHGPYCWPDDLPEIYGSCDLAWLIDRFDAGSNSDWLLPNRLYEGGLFNAVPIALAQVEVGRKLAALNCGILVPNPGQDAVIDRLGALDAESILAERSKMAALPAALWCAGKEDCTSLVEAFRTISRRPKPSPAATGRGYI